MRPIFAILLLASPPALRAEHTAAAAHAALEQGFGKKGVDALRRRGFISLAGGKEGMRIIHVQWELVKNFEESAPAFGAFLDLYEANRRRLSVSGSPADLGLLQRLPLGGIMTPSLRAAVDALAVLQRDAAALGKRLDDAAGTADFFSAPWSKDFAARRSAALLLTPGKEAPVFFREVLRSHETAEASRQAVIAYSKAAYGAAIEEELDSDLAKGKLSSGTRKHLENYLNDQKLLRSVSQTRSRLKDIERSGTLREDAADLRLLLDGFNKEKSVEAVLRGAFGAGSGDTASESGIRFSAPDLHVHSEDGSTDLDVGDTAVISLAFWIYGVREGDEIEVSQLAFTDRGVHGISDRTETKSRLNSGGPYTFTAKVPVRSAEPFLFRLLLDATEAKPFSRAIEIKPSPRYYEFLALAAEADREAASCMLDDAVDRYDAVRESIAPHSKKKLFKNLLRGVESRRKTAQRQGDLYEGLQGALDGAKLFASQEQCDYSDGRARRALAALAELPAGCDQIPGSAPGKSVGEELRDLTRLTQRRAAAQEGFTRALKSARENEARCRSEDAVSLYTAALALLDADPAARCGQWERNYTLARIEDLPRAAAASRMVEALSGTVADAENKFSAGDAPAALQLLLPALAKIDAMPDASCYDGVRSRIAELSAAYGIALSPGSPAETNWAADFPNDTPDAAVEAVITRRGEREAQRRAARERELKRQAPGAAGGAR